MSSTRSAAISDLADVMVRPSSSTSRSSEASFAVRSWLMVVSTARTTSVTIADSTWGWFVRIEASFCFSASMPTAAGSLLGSSMTQDFFNLALERFGVEWLDDIVRTARRFGGDDVFRLAFGGAHDERQRFQAIVRTHFLQQLQSGHRGHIPVADHQAEVAARQFGQRLRAVRGFLDIVEVDLLEQDADDPQHRLVII